MKRSSGQKQLSPDISTCLRLRLGKRESTVYHGKSANSREPEIFFPLFLTEEKQLPPFGLLHCILHF